MSCRPRSVEMSRSRSISSAAVRPSSGTARNRVSHASSASTRRRNASALVSSIRSSYAVRPRLDAIVGESSYSSFRNEPTSQANSVATSAPRGEWSGARIVSLDEYQRKRDFRRTPEPKGKKPAAKAERRYVVHRHHATRLHWDVRLEMHGILASWAVPQGPPPLRSPLRPLRWLRRR